MKPLRALAAIFCGGLAAASAAQAPPAPPTPTQALTQGIAHDALFAIAFDGLRGIAGGAPGRVLHSEDGGKSWARDTGFPSPLAVLGVDLKDGRAIAVGQMGTVFTHADGRWKKSDSGTVERLMNVSLSRRGLAVAVGAFGTVIKSSDHGATWQAIAPDWKPHLNADQLEQGIQPHMSAVHAGEDGTITIAGEFSLILRSLDGGASWKSVNRGDAAIFALDLRADGAGYAVGQDGLILRSADGGASWTRLPAVTKANLLGVRSAGAAVLVSAMHDMLASDDGGANWRHVVAPDVQAAWYSGVGVVNGSFLAVGHSGRIVKVNR